MGFRNRLTVHWGYSGHGWPDIFAPGGPLVHPGPEPAGPAAPAQHGCAVPGQSGGRRPQLRVPGVPGQARQDAHAPAPAPEHAGGLSSAAEGEAVRLLQGAPAPAVLPKWLRAVTTRATGTILKQLKQHYLCRMYLNNTS